MTGLDAAQTYVLDSDLAGAWFEIIDATPASIAGGVAPLTFTVPTSGDYSYVIYDDAACAATSTCREAILTCTTCPPPPCLNTADLFDLNAFTVTTDLNLSSYCGDDATNIGLGFNPDPAEIFVAFTVTPPAFPDANAPYDVTTTQGMFYQSTTPPTLVGATMTLGSGDIAYLNVNQADIDASGGTTTLNFVTDATNPNPGNCNLNLVINWADLLITTGGTVATVAEDLCPATTCPDPSALTVTAITTTSADIGWTENGSAPSWEVEIVAAGGTPTGTGMAAATNPYPATGLTSATGYDAYVRSNCGPGGFSAWIGPISFFTLCNSFTAPYCNDFEAMAATTTTIAACNTNDNVSDCWANDAANTNFWLVSSVGTSSTSTGPTSANTGSNFAYLEASGGCNNISSILTSPVVDVSGLTNPAFIFDYHLWGTDQVANAIQVEASTDGTTWANVFTTGGDLGNVWNNEIVDLIAYAGATTLQVRIIGTTGASFNSDVALDQMCIDELPLCPAPSAINATNVTDMSADIGWTENGTATTWEIEIVMGGMTPTGTGVSTTTNPYAATGLTSLTTYDVYVRADCGGSFSTWTGPTSFITACGTADAPANDLCGGAIALTLGSGACGTPTVASNFCSSQAITPTPTCAFFTGGTDVGEVWYTVTVPASGEVTVQTSSGGANPVSDTGLAIYSSSDGTCTGTLTQLSCNDDAVGLFSEIALTGQNPGDVLYAVAWEYGNNASGTFNICAWDPNPVVACPTSLMIETSDEGDYSATVLMEGDDIVASNTVNAGATVAVTYDGTNSVTLVEAGVTGDTDGFEAIPTADGSFLATVGDGCTTLGSFKVLDEDDATVQEFENGIDSKVTSTFTLTAAPNPVQDIATITFESNEDSEAIIEVFDLRGQKMAILYKEDVSADQPYQLKLNVTDFANGIYLIRLISDKGEAQTVKLSVQH